MAAFMKLKGEDTSKAIVHPQYQPEASKAIVHPQYQEAAKAIVHPQYQPQGDESVVQPEADGYMKFGDIKGEFSPSRESLGGSSYSPWDHDVINASDFAPATKDIGWWTVDGANFRDHNHGKRSNWDVICDVGTFIKQEGIDLQSDALVQQVNDFAGYETQAGIGSEHWAEPAAEMFATGSAVDSWTEKTFGNGDGEILGGISQGNVFAPVNVLRSDNRF